MADVKWMKMMVGMFDGMSFKKIKRAKIGGESFRDKLTAVWFELMDFAGRCNHDGAFVGTNEIPFTDLCDIATMIDREEEELRLCMAFYIKEGMITIVDDVYSLTNWASYQNKDGLDRIRESKRLAQAKWRAKQKALPPVSTVESTVESTRCLVDGTEEDKEEDKETDKEERNKERNDCQQIADLYNSICVSFPSIRSLSEARKKAIRARMKTYTVDDFRNVFKNAEASSFLKGGNDRNWTATFDWLIKDSNMAKVLDGNYCDKAPAAKTTKPVTGKRPSYDLEAFERMNLATPAPTAGEDETIRRRAEELQKRLGTAERTG